MTIRISLPIFIPPPLGLAAPIEVNLNLGDLTLGDEMGPKRDYSSIFP